MDEERISWRKRWMRIDAIQKEFKRKQKEKDIETMVPDIKLGALKQYTEGKYGPTDEGAISFAIGSDETNQRVFIEYATPVTWLAMNPQQAMTVAQALIEHAKKISKEPLTLALDE